MGAWVIRRPVALKTALAMAPSGGMIGASPTPLLPRGWSGRLPRTWPYLPLVGDVGLVDESLVAVGEQRFQQRLRGSLVVPVIEA